MVSAHNAEGAAPRPAKKVRYELLTLGDELLLGLTPNGHLTFIGAQLGRRGALLERNITITDEADAIAAQFRESWARADVVIHMAAEAFVANAFADPMRTWRVNVDGTLQLAHAIRETTPDAVLIYISSAEIYGLTFQTGAVLTEDAPLAPANPYAASKAAADLLVQEYGRYFDMPTVCFRGGCLTGPQHAGAELHGFLSYLVKCAVTGNHYTVYGYDGKQVRDNIHSYDVVQAFLAFHRAPKAAAVYNLGGGRESNISMREAVLKCEALTGRPMNIRFDGPPRIGDHRWWISDLSAFKADYPGWGITRSVRDTMAEIHQATVSRAK